MNIKNFIREFGDSDYGNDVLRSFGLTARSGVGAGAVTALGFLTLGVIVGAGAALFLAPTTAEDLRERAREGIDKLRSYVDMTSTSGSKKSNNGSRHSATTHTA